MPEFIFWNSTFWRKLWYWNELLGGGVMQSQKVETKKVQSAEGIWPPRLHAATTIPRSSSFYNLISVRLCCSCNVICVWSPLPLFPPFSFFFIYFLLSVNLGTDIPRPAAAGRDMAAQEWYGRHDREQRWKHVLQLAGLWNCFKKRTAGCILGRPHSFVVRRSNIRNIVVIPTAAKVHQERLLILQALASRAPDTAILSVRIPLLPENYPSMNRQLFFKYLRRHDVIVIGPIWAPVPECKR